MSLTTRSSCLMQSTLTPFLYPCLDSTWHARRPNTSSRPPRAARRWQNTASLSTPPPSPSIASPPVLPEISPSDYTNTPFTDSCSLTLSAGPGGHGCISFLREKYIPDGPANGGDGGTGGAIYIQALRGETSLHKLARRGTLKAGRGKNGQGTAKGGRRGEDVVLTVPVGTVVREVWRVDPVEEEEMGRRGKGFGADLDREQRAENDVEQEEEGKWEGTDQSLKWRREKWLLYPGILPKSFTSADFPALPRPRRSNLAISQPPAPLRLDLDKPMTTPMLLAAGAMGGLGNPHFVTKSVPRPKFATKGDDALRIHVQLELKLLADIGLVGLPNAGKSTLLRAMTASRARVGDWAFTTLSPNIGTVVLDNQRGRVAGLTSLPVYPDGEPRTHFTIADIPGLIPDAHLDRGLGLGFLKHIERAGVLAFVVDLGAGDAVEAVKALWKEVGEYENLRSGELNAETQRTAPGEDALSTYQPFTSAASSSELGGDLLLDPQSARPLPPLTLPPISSKPWVVVATKADLPETQENFAALQTWLAEVQAGMHAHPSGKKNGWRRKLHALPVCGLKKEGIEGLRNVFVELLGER
ncbi:hypothetical protein B0A48_00011 [Cryoendolithus antarcticus]|uniref:Obg family GTPase CgtA n=1 Tax=Cryoendolithus antarcticus TaxID=1507870 RepID=A0A1V8TTF0_9PEZI|nr:hypothetical protein B0A48_00011 [Cryoendolithus antarcticus]